MDDGHLGHIESSILQIYLPGIDKQHRKALRRICKEKGIAIYNPDLQNTLKNLLGSIIRHRETCYEEMVHLVGKDRARFYVQPIIDNQMGRQV